MQKSLRNVKDTPEVMMHEYVNIFRPVTKAQRDQLSV